MATADSIGEQPDMGDPIALTGVAGDHLVTKHDKKESTSTSKRKATKPNPSFHLKLVALE